MPAAVGQLQCRKSAIFPGMAAFGRPHCLLPGEWPKQHGGVLWVNVVAELFCCPDMTRSSPSSPSLPALSFSASLGNSQVGRTSEPPVSQPEHLCKGQGRPSWELSAGEILFPEQGVSWLPVVAFVLTPPGWVLLAEFLESW